jgi:hypothetical protein
MGYKHKLVTPCGPSKKDEIANLMTFLGKKGSQTLAPAASAGVCDPSVFDMTFVLKETV